MVSFFRLLSDIFGGSSINSSSKKQEKTDWLMSWEQDLVNKGEYEPYNFEEENMEEDDYYYEDDN